MQVLANVRFWPRADPLTEAIQEREWKALHKDLTALLERHGKQDAFGKGDFWIVDDNYGSTEQKVCVTRLQFLTRPVATDVQRLLRKYTLGWEILFSLDDEKMRPTRDDIGVIVRKTGIREHWSNERMERHFGADFRWQFTPLQKWVKDRPFVYWGLAALLATYFALRLTGVIPNGWPLHLLGVR
jgi:hypothetical protein